MMPFFSYQIMGMFFSAFIAGSIFPFSSEVIMIGLLSTGSSPIPLLLTATIGNALGSMVNYLIGRLGRYDWAERYFRIEREKIEKTKAYIGQKGAFIGIFSFLPIVGSVISFALGFLRINPWLSFSFITIGKFIRYVVITLPYL